MKKVTEKLTTLSNDEKMIGLYNAEIEDEKILRTRLHGAEIKGEKRGLEKGIQKRNIEIAKNLLKNNVAIDIISNSTGLTKEKLETINKI